MSVEAEQLDDWVGSEVVDPSGEKLGKVSEVYYLGTDALVVEIRSGLLGRKHALAALKGSSVSMKHLRLSEAETVETDGGLGNGALEQLAAHDERLKGVTADDVESGTARAERLAAAQAAADRAAALEAAAAEHRADAEDAARHASEAQEFADDATRKTAEAEQQAAEARAKAAELGD